MQNFEVAIRDAKRFRKNDFFKTVWRIKTAERDFWQKTRALFILAPLRNDFILRFKLNGVFSEDFSRKKYRKIYITRDRFQLIF